MGWFGSLVHAATHPGSLLSDGEHLLSDGEHLLGQVTNEGTHLVGRGLTDIGLGQVGNVVDGWGDDAADALDPELQLGQTSDPTQLIHGDASAIRKTASSLHEFSGAFGQTASGLSGIDTSHWTGAAADAFRAKYAPAPGKWRDASTASGNAGGALESYAGTVEWAQGQARQAIALYARGQNATDAAVTAYNAAAKAYDAKLSAAHNAGVRPTEPGAFSDPGASMRDQAQQLLASARAERDRAGAAAASVVGKATDMAPASPGFWSQAGDTFSDTNQGMQLAGSSFDAGVLTGVADIGKLARDLNPDDPWNMSHPAEYLAGVSGIAAGLVHDAVNPQDLVGQMFSGAGSDPAFALGKLVPQVALAAVTGGAGAGADAGADAATEAATNAAEDAAANVARPPADMPTVGDPVDVATGDVVVPQTDVRLPAVLPLVVGRVHRSSYRGGRWFGRSWASTLDQRLVVSGQAVVFAAEDGAALCYPRPPADGVPVLPVGGRRWPLVRGGDGYTVTDSRSGVTWRFAPLPGSFLSAAGDGELPLLLVTDRAGHRIRFRYSDDGSPESVTHDGGYQLRVVVSGGRVAGLVLAGAGPGGLDVPLTWYRYNQAGDLAEVVNSSGIPQRFSYDQAGRLTGWEDRNGFSYRYHYDDYGRCVRGEGPGGTLSGAFAYDRAGLVTTYTDAVGAVARYQVTPRGQVAAITDPLGHVTRYEHDARGQLVSRADALARITRWSYDSAGNLAEVTRPDGSRAAAVYDKRNLPLTMTEPDGAIWRLGYNAAGNPTQRTAPDGSVTEYSYDSRGHLVAVTGPDGTTVLVECDAAGLPLSATSADGARSRYERDAFGRITAATAPDGSVTQVAWTVEGLPLSRTFPDGTVERYAYDGEGNLTGHQGRAGEVTRFEYGGFGQMLARVWPDGTRTCFGYDHALRLTTVTHGRLTWRYERDQAGRLIAETDYNGAVTRYAHDAVGQLTGRVNAAGQELTFAYDLLGNLAERRADGKVTKFGYDPAARLAWARNPDAQLEFSRDRLGRITAETCNGRTVHSDYGAAGRRVRRLTPSGADARWGYDTAGRLATLLTAGQELRFGYDQAGRETLRELPGGLRLSQKWDTAGRLAAQTLTATAPAPAAGVSRIPAGSTAGGSHVLQHRTYSYRGDGCLTGLQDLLSGPRRLTLDPAGRVTAVAGPDWAEQYSYDPAGNIVGATWPAPPPGLDSDWLEAAAQGTREHAGTLVGRAGDIRYQHDACGRIILRQRIRDSRKPGTWRYQWDAANRLTSVATPDGTTWRYVYDPLGRRIAKRRLTTGGQLADQVTFTWDGPVLAEQAAERRGMPGGGSQITTWECRPGAFTPLTQHTRTVGPGNDSGDQARQDQVDAEFYAIVADLIGAPAELVSPDGGLAGYQQRTLWGVTAWHPVGAATPLRFPGQYEDPETGLHYNFHRYYDPATGAYLSPDPLGLTPAPNPHAYVANPHILADPLGLDPASAVDTGNPSWRGVAAREPVWTGPQTVFRADGRPSSVIFSEGFEPAGTDMNLFSHLSGGRGDSNYIATFKDEAAAREWSSGVRNVYKIQARGVDAEATYGEYSRAGGPVPMEGEVSVPGGIPASQIEAVLGPDGQWIPNPSFVP